MVQSKRTMGLFLLACLTFYQTGFSQIGFRPKTLRASFYNEATSLPTIRHLVRMPVHPAINIGTDFWVKSGNHWQKSLGADLTFYHHRLNENALMLDAIYALGYQFNFGLQPKIIAVAGYKHSFAPSESYVFKNGEYQKETNWGTSHVNVKLGLGLEYAVNDKISITSDYKFMMDAPYSESIPFSAHTFLGLGLKINLANRHEETQGQPQQMN